MRTTRRQSFRSRRQALRCLAGVAAGGLLAACGTLNLRDRPAIVLVHGSWHGPWCWDKLTPLLRERGHPVSAVDLQGQGANRVPVERIDLALYTKRVTDELDLSGAPVILVGHSSGCLAASQAAEERPGKVLRLVFVSGFVAANGEAQRALVGKDPDQKVAPLLRVDFRPGTKIPFQTRIDVSNPEAVKLAFYNDCSDADARAAIARLVPEPVGPSVQPLRLSTGNFGRVDKAYVHCTRDNAVSLARQRQFAATWPMRRTIALDSGHSPFISMPARLAQALSEEITA